MTIGGGDFPPAACRPADTITTASTGVGRGARVRAVVEDIGRQQRTRQVHFLLEEPLGEGIASTLPPPLVRVPSEGPFPRPWLPRDIPLTRVAEPRPQEVQPPVAISRIWPSCCTAGCGTVLALNTMAAPSWQNC